MPVAAVQRSVGEAAGTATDAHAAAFQNAASQAPGAGGGNPAANGGSDSQAQTRSGGVPPGGGSASPGAADVAKRVNPPATLPDTPTLPNPPAAPSGPDPHGGNLAADFESKVQSGDVDAVMRLIHDKPKGFDINATLPGTGGQNALQLVMSQGTQGQTSSDLAEALLQGGIDDTHLDGAGQSAYALAKGKASDSSSAGKDYQALATKVGRDLNTKLDQAVAKGDADAVGRLVTAGADVNAKDDQGRTALFYAYSGVLGQPMVLPGTSTGLGQPGAPNQAGQALIAHGADLTATDNDGKSINDYITATLNTPTSGREPDASWHSDLRKAANDLHDAATQQLRKAVLDDGKDGAAPGHAPVLDQALTEAKAVALVKQAGADAGASLSGDSSREQNISSFQALVGMGDTNAVHGILANATDAERKSLINDQWSGGTAMHIAAAAGQNGLYDDLKKAGGDDQAKNAAGKTPSDLHSELQKRVLPLIALGGAAAVVTPAAIVAGVGVAAYLLYRAWKGESGPAPTSTQTDPSLPATPTQPDSPQPVPYPFDQQTPPDISGLFSFNDNAVEWDNPDAPKPTPMDSKQIQPTLEQGQAMMQDAYQKYMPGGSAPAYETYYSQSVIPPEFRDPNALGKTYTHPNNNSGNVIVYNSNRLLRNYQTVRAIGAHEMGHAMTSVTFNTAWHSLNNRPMALSMVEGIDQWLTIQASGNTLQKDEHPYDAAVREVQRTVDEGKLDRDTIAKAQFGGDEAAIKKVFAALGME